MAAGSAIGQYVASTLYLGKRLQAEAKIAGGISCRNESRSIRTYSKLSFFKPLFTGVSQEGSNAIPTNRTMLV